MSLLSEALLQVLIFIRVVVVEIHLMESSVLFEFCKLWGGYCVPWLFIAQKPCTF